MNTLLISMLMVAGCKKKDDAVTDVPDVIEAPAPEVTEVVEEAPTAPSHVTTIVENFGKVFFDYDSSELNDTSKAALDENVSILQEHPSVKVQIQGHTDERGTTDYNLALGNRRANQVMEYLAGQGIAPSRLAVLSYGEEAPLTAGSTEHAWSQNRRAEFVVTWGGEGQVGSSTD